MAWAHGLLNIYNRMIFDHAMTKKLNGNADLLFVAEIQRFALKFKIYLKIYKFP